MIKTINIKVSAGDPQAPLGPFYIVKESAASLTIVDVPRPFGVRTVTGVTVKAKNAAGTTVGVAAVRNGSAWGATIPGSHFATTGTITAGIVIEATGKGDDGSTASWVLGMGQVMVIDDTGAISAGEVRWECDWYDSVPSSPKKGAMCKRNGAVNVYTSRGWVALGGDPDAIRTTNFEDVELLPASFTENQMREKVNEVIGILKGAAVAAFAFMATFASAGVNVYTAPKGAVLNTTPIVTNVTFTGSEGVDTNAVKAISAQTVTNNVAPWALKGNDNPSGMTTNQVNGIIDGRVASGDLCPSNTAAALAASAEARAKAAIPDAYTKSQADAAFYPKSSGSSLATQVSTIGAHLNAEDARFVSTNYNSVTRMPEAYVEIKLPDGTWSRIWAEMTRWNWLLGQYLPTNYYGKAQVDGMIAQKADRAWGAYDSETGEYAPDDYTWISSKKIAIAANLAYQRTVTSDGSVWVLESNGTVTQTGGLTNGFFRISDDEGNALFEIVKGNKRTVGADASGVTTLAGFSPTKLQINYSIVSDVHPTISVTTSLSSPNWKAETDADCVANVVWSGSSGAWVAQVQGKGPGSYPSLFVKATYEVGGQSYIDNKAAVALQKLVIGGVTYNVGTATISGNTVLTLTPAP